METQKDAEGRVLMPMKLRNAVRGGRSSSKKTLNFPAALEGAGNGSGQFLPSGMGLIELALQAGFVVPVLLGREATAEERDSVCPGEAK
jgi:hypothetical protein